MLIINIHARTTSFIYLDDEKINIKKTPITDNEEINNFIQKNAPLYCEYCDCKYRIFDDTYNWIDCHSKSTHKSQSDAVLQFSSTVSREGLKDVLLEVRGENDRKNVNITHPNFLQKLSRWNEKKKQLQMIIE